MFDLSSTLSGHVCLICSFIANLLCFLDSIAPRGGSRSRPVSRILEDKSGQVEAAVSKDEGRATLRLKKKGEAVMEKVRWWTSE